MLDINLIRNETEKVRQALLKRMDDLDFSDLLEWDRKRRELLVEMEIRTAPTVINLSQQQSVPGFGVFRFPDYRVFE